uniref:DNA/RNA-binding protein Alba-like domain-containing protein n=1 Tax=Mastacembelus armatus TaxID=205130 RepID=A0A7N8Y174_9TELE
MNRPKVCRTEEESPCPFPGLATGVLEMRVKEGSKIRNLMGFAMARIGAGLRQVVFTGSGRAVTKTITCAEIMKRKVGSLHQLTKLRYKVVKEVWESTEEGTSEMTVHRTVPSISILLSKDPLDPQEPGYQPPETLSALLSAACGQIYVLALCHNHLHSSMLLSVAFKNT